MGLPRAHRDVLQAYQHQVFNRDASIADTLLRLRPVFVFHSPPRHFLQAIEQREGEAEVNRPTSMNRLIVFATLRASFARVTGWGGLRKSLVGISLLQGA